MLAAKAGESMLVRLRQLGLSTESLESVQSPSEVLDAIGHARTSEAVWTAQIRALCEKLQHDIPKGLFSPSDDTQNMSKDGPLPRYFKRERDIASALLHTVHTDIKLLLSVCAGSRKQTNHIRHLIKVLLKGANCMPYFFCSFCLA